MEQKCQCCGQSRSGVRCGYCGFYEVVSLDEGGDKQVEELVQLHRQERIGALSELSVTTYESEWKDDSPTVQKKEQKLAKGSDCYPDVKWCRQKFGQLASEEMLQLTCRIGGKKKRLQCRLPSVHSEDFLRLGLRIDETLHLRIFLGSPKKYAQSEPIPLEWE